MAKAKTVKTKAAKQTKSVFDTLEPLPSNTWGMSRVKPGFASSPQAATLLGLGYPHIILPSTEDFTGTDQELFKRQDLRVIPRNALERLYRAHTRREGPLSLDAEIDHILRRGGVYVVFLLEALYGSEATARSFVDRLAALPDSEWTGDGEIENYGWMMIRMFAFTLWRVSAGTREELRGKLEAIYQRFPGSGRRQVKALDMILHGRTAVERCGRGYNGKTHLTEFLYADDDPAWMASQTIERMKTLRPADRAAWDIQLAVVGGPKVLAALKASTKCFKADQKRAIETQLSLVS